MEKMPSSFKDPSGCVYVHKGRILRAVSERARQEWNIFQNSGLFLELQQKGYLQNTVPVSFDDIPRPQGTAYVFEHTPFPFISYPFEWSFSMLRDAGIFHLELLAYCLERGFITKDGSAYNIQFVDGKPLFIDPFSFVEYRKGDPWVGFAQFARHFLFPLMISAYKRIPFHSFLRDKLDGIDIHTARRFFSWSDTLKPGVALYVLIQELLQSGFENTKEHFARSISASHALQKGSLSRMAYRLRSFLDSLPVPRFASQWEHYERTHAYSSADAQEKKEFVERAAAEVRPALLCDVGANAGEYAFCAAPFAKHIVAVDSDYQAVDALYRRAQSSYIRNILPLVVDFVNPSPGLGWRLQERSSFFDRVRPDMVFALALVHHIVIGANVPLEDFIDWLMRFSPVVVLEFVDKKDPNAVRLLKDKEDVYPWYTQEALELAICARGSILQKRQLPCGTRTMYMIQRAV